MTIQPSVGERIAILRPLLILGIVYVHTGGVVDDISWQWSNPFEYLQAVFRNGLFRASVPMLTLISGFLLFRACLDQAPKKLFAKKFRTLVIPFLVFNLLFIAVMLPLEAFFGFSHYVKLLGSDLSGWLDRLFALRGNPYNFPLYFLRDMIVLVVLAPLFGLMLRRAPLLGLAAVSVIFFYDFDGSLVLRSTSAILFYIGGMAAIHRWNLLALDKYAKPFAVVIVAACLASIALRSHESFWLALTLPFLMWPAASLLHGTRIGQFAVRYNKYSFFIFVTHAPVMYFGWQFILAYARFIPYPVYYVFAPALTVAFLIVVYRGLMRVAPAAFNFALGNRDKQAPGASEAERPAAAAYQTAP